MDPLRMSSHSPSDLTGLVLHLDGWGELQPLTLRFYKDRTKVVHIGRKSAQNSGEYVATDDRALFRCAVVSRQHAKLIFTEHGNVSVTDLGSHHGTHLLKSGETTSKSLPAQVAHTLADGDTIIFGKSVIRDDSQVRPVVARIELEYSSPPELPSPTTCAKDLPEQQGSKGSGRYGVYVSSSSSSSDDESDNDSVVYLHSSPPTRRSHSSNFLPSFQSLRSANFSLDSIRSSMNADLFCVLPPIHTLSSASVSPSSSVQEISPIAEHFARGGPSASASSTVGGIGLHTDPEVIGAWPKTPVLSRSRSGTPFPRGSPSTSSKPSEDRADTHAFPVEDIGHTIANVDAEVDMPIDKPDEQLEQAHAISQPSIECSANLDDSQSSLAPETEGAQNDNEVVGGGAVQVNEVDLPPATVGESELISERIVEDVPVDEAESNVQPEVADTVVETNTVSVEVPTTTESKSPTFISPDAWASMKASVTAIEELRRKAEEDLAAIKAAHAETELTLAKLKENVTMVGLIHSQFRAGLPHLVQTTTLKRKRPIEDDDDDSVALDSVPSSVLLLPVAPVQAPAKRRRVMRFVSKVAQTTAIASVGAVAAWSALAFS
ncbi:unnamed protein product [Somion occarium]|uniref:FHA domain-containing protein n=1 Tax=Somion occarium TaxID=3059160 RepID=A0ABP1D1S7_9APHY